MDKTKLRIRNSTAEFLVFTRQAGEDGIEVRVEDETIWLTQKLMATLFDVDVRTISEHLGNVYQAGEQSRSATIRKFRIVRLEDALAKGQNAFLVISGRCVVFVAMGWAVNGKCRASVSLAFGG